jgi:hypothetical protein
MNTKEACRLPDFPKNEDGDVYCPGCGEVTSIGNQVGVQYCRGHYRKRFFLFGDTIPACRFCVIGKHVHVWCEWCGGEYPCKLLSESKVEHD